VRLEVGRAGRAHGLRGEITVSLITNRTERVEPGAVLYAGDQALVVDSSRPNRGRWVVAFEGITDRGQAEALTGCVLTADAAGEPPDGGVWLHDFVGASVRDTSGATLGRVTAIDANPAHDILVIDDTLLVPVIFVTDYGADAIVVDVPDGLVDLNRR